MASSWDVVFWKKEKKKVDYLPSSWRVNGNKDKYLWPKVSSKTKLKKMIDECTAPNISINFEEHPGICKATVDSLVTAEAFVRELQNKTDVSSDVLSSEIELESAHDFVHEFTEESAHRFLQESPQTSDEEISINVKPNTHHEIQKILKSIAAIQFEIKQNRTTLKEIQASLLSIHQLISRKDKEESEIDITFATLPIETTEDFESIEEKLGNKIYYDKLVNMLSLISSSKDIKKLTHTITKKLLSKEQSMNFSALGKKGKKNFSKFRCYNLIIDVVRAAIPSAKEDEIRSYISICLAQAGDRDGGRKNRTQTEQH